MKTSFITAAIAIAAIYFLTGCQVTVTAKPDYSAWYQLLTGDEIPRAIIPTK